MRVELKTKRYFTCPNGCKHEMTVEHLLGDGPCGVTKDYPKRQAGPWYCDECGQGWKLTYDADSVDVEPVKGKKVDQWVILELPPQTEPIRFKVKAMRIDRELDESADQYFYEEHTCPTNWLRRVEEVSIGEDDDPHGLFKHVRTYDAEASDGDAS
jgi:hypothetical protein